MKPVFTTAVALFGLYVGAANAQEQAPVTPEILETALRLEGKWGADASLQVGGKTYAFKYNMDFRKTAGGSGLLMYETANIPGIGKLEGTGVIGYDPYDGKLHWFSVDNLGTTTILVSPRESDRQVGPRVRERRIT